MASAHASRAGREGPVARIVLPVSGATVALHHPTGAEDLLMTEHSIDDPGLTLALVERLGQAEPELNWAELPVTDIDTMILRLRQAVIGNRVTAGVTCAAPACGQRVDLSFDVDAYLAHHQPRRGRRGQRVKPCADTTGWFVLQSERGAPEPVRFRLPMLADQIAVDGLADAVTGLAARCIQATELSRRVRSRVEAAMAMLAPPLDGPLQGLCPHCAAPIASWFEARRYCLKELQDRARFIYDDVNTLAECYHWPEQAILALPHVRRTHYVERARQARLV